MKQTSIVLLAAVVVGFGARSIAGAQQADMAAMQRWGSAKVIYYTTEKLSYSADKKSMIVKDGNWTWTFTPSVTPPGK